MEIKNKLTRTRGGEGGRGGRKGKGLVKERVQRTQGQGRWGGDCLGERVGRAGESNEVWGGWGQL